MKLSGVSVYREYAKKNFKLNLILVVVLLFESKIMNIESATPSTTTLKPPDVLTINIAQVSQCPRSPMVNSGYATSGYQPQYWSKRAGRKKRKSRDSFSSTLLKLRKVSHV